MYILNITMHVTHNYVKYTIFLVVHIDVQKDKAYIYMYIYIFIRTNVVIRQTTVYIEMYNYSVHKQKKNYR